MQTSFSRPGSIVMTATISPSGSYARQTAHAGHATEHAAGHAAGHASGEADLSPRAPGKRKQAPASAPAPGEIAFKRHRVQTGMRVRVVSAGLFADITPRMRRRPAEDGPATQPPPGRQVSRWQHGMTAIPMRLPQILEEELEPGSPPQAQPASPARPALRFTNVPPSFPRPGPHLPHVPHVALEVRTSPAIAAPASASALTPPPPPPHESAPASPAAWRPSRPAPGYHLREMFAQEPERVVALQRHAQDRHYGGADREPLEALDDLFRALRRVGPVAVQTNASRALLTLEYLVSREVTPEELATYVSRGGWLDLVQTVPAAVFIYGASFLTAAGLATLLEPETSGLVSDPLAPCPEAGAMPPWLSATLLHLLGDVIIGVGGEWATAVLREGRLDQRYTRPQDFRRGEDGLPRPFSETPAGRWIQALSALPFAALYIAHRRFPELMGPPLARLGLGAAAATTSGLWREGMAQALAWETDSLWLDGSTEERHDRMRAALRALRSPTSTLLPGVQSLWQGLRRATGQPDAAATVRALMRGCMALVARGGSLVAAAQGRQNDPVWIAAADAWLGLSWGYLSTLPARGTRLLASGLAASLPARPVKATQVAAPRAVAPPLPLTPGDGVLTPR